MELSQVVKIAQAHLDGEDISHTDVLNAFKAFINEKTPLHEKSWCQYSLSLIDIWNKLRNVIISEEEAAKFLDNYSLSSSEEEEIWETFSYRIENHFKDFPEGSILHHLIELGDIEAVRQLSEIDTGYEPLDESVCYEYYNDALEFAVEMGQKEIVKLLAAIDGIDIPESVVSKATDEEIREILKAAKG